MRALVCVCVCVALSCFLYDVEIWMFGGRALEDALFSVVDKL